MLFNTLDFAIFLPIVFAIYWIIGSERVKAQNLLLTVASYVFYGWWDWRFLILIFLSTIVDYGVGQWLSKEETAKRRKGILLISVVFNLGLLGFFKYYNFFLENFVSAFSFFGSEVQSSSLNIILPVGISFYTFQTLSYTIDIYRGKLQPTKDLNAFMGYVSFFPQLVAGPIERASRLLPQFLSERKLEYSKAVDGLRQILWGLVKKVIIADNCAQVVDVVFSNHTDQPASALVLGAIFFSFQVYCDFSGYSDMAIGLARLFGFNLSQNFAYPFFSRDINELWRRWHISLLSWFRDYLYTPLARGRKDRGNHWFKSRNVIILFGVSGLWHGANWTFIVWGLINALLILPSALRKTRVKRSVVVAQGKVLPSMKELFQIFSTFGLFVFGAVFFRSRNIQQAFEYIESIFSVSLFTLPEIGVGYYSKLLLVLLFIMLEWNGREEQFAIARFGLNWKWPFRYAFYYGIVLLVLWYSSNAQQFIYFQF